MLKQYKTREELLAAEPMYEKWEEEGLVNIEEILNCPIEKLIALADIETKNLNNSDARGYLATTDWYVTREAETGTAMPKDVSAKRAEARTAIV
jgi:hypothetical protein